jgi:hypothetical protein
MEKIAVYTDGNFANIDQLPMHREWMDATANKHAYHCFPVSLSNRLGWGISYPEDISFIWDGISDTTEDHVKILSGSRYVNSRRSNATISFNTSLTFVKENEQNLTLMTMPAPNQFVRGAQCMTTLISTSVLQGELPIAWMITEPNIEIKIPANTPIAAILPISLSEIQSYELEVHKGRPSYEDIEWQNKMRKRSQTSQERNSKGDWTHFYRDAIDAEENPMGKHEAKKIIMKVTNVTKN